MALNRIIRIAGYIVILVGLLFVSTQWLSVSNINQNEVMISEINVLAASNSHSFLLYI